MIKIKYLLTLVLLLFISKIVSAQTLRVKDLLKYVYCSDTACINDIYKKGFRFLEKLPYTGPEYVYESLADTAEKDSTVDWCGTTISFIFRKDNELLAHLSGIDNFITQITFTIDIDSLYNRLLNEFKEKKFVATDMIPIGLCAGAWQSKPSIKYASSSFKKVYIVVGECGVQPCDAIEITRMP